MNLPSRPVVHDDEQAILQDILVLSTAYRQAQDEDIMNANNAMSTARSQADVEGLLYYVVSLAWFRKAYSVLTYGLMNASGQLPTFSAEWKDAIGAIENAVLTEPRKPAFLDELKKKSKQGFSPLPTKLNGNHGAGGAATPPPHADTGSVAAGMKHAIDYVLVGSNVWLLLAQKFGCDVSLQAKCVFTARSHQATDSTSSSTSTAICLRVNNDQSSTSQSNSVPMPASGRFPYEQYLLRDHQSSAIADQVVSDDDEDPPPAPTAAAATDDYFDDLFPSIDDTSVSARSATTDLLTDDQHPIILLPPPSNHRGMDDDDDDGDDTNDDWNSNYNNDYDDQGTGTVVLRRRFGSGLGNLGNTCFMNSTLQCLAHTQPLQRYFLTGAYVQDLNRENPLGTGGELATQFAQLLSEMWGSKQVVRRGLSGAAIVAEDHRSNMYTTASNVVYPKNFKYTLGKHAEQFMGYDQHDSQELATYLLDALHEDCNRVTRKPYVEKPEQAEEETDQEASDKAWDLHLKREDSRVLENFMGQVKSRVQCCKPECGRVSTTFDPFMFLSVPIPGSEDRTLRFTYVSLDPNIRAKKLAVKVSKMASIEEMLKKIIELLPAVGFLTDPSSPPAIEDFAVCDIWKKEVFDWIKHVDEVEKIRDNDDTLVYQLRPLAEIRAIEAKNAEAAASGGDAATAEVLGIRDVKRSKHYQLDIATMTRINRGDEWLNEMRNYSRSPLMFANAFNRRKGTSDDRVRIYRKLTHFIDQCHKAVEGDDTPGQKRTRADTVDDSSGGGEVGGGINYLDASTIPEIMERCDVSTFFCGVKSKYDVAVLEFLAGKMFKEIMSMERQMKDAYPNGVKIEVRIRKDGLLAAAPFVLRIPSDMTVFGLREEIAHRLSRSLKTVVRSRAPKKVQASIWEDPEDPALSSDDDQQSDHPTAVMGTDISMGSPESWIVRRIPLTYERRSTGHGPRNYSISKQLGSIGRPGNYFDGGCATVFAQPSHAEERELVAELVGNLGQVFLDWPADLVDDAFDLNEYQAVDEPAQSEAITKNSITVLDCIEKFCQMEQLEESEQWYCSRCKAHVCAWKQFHIYRSPPHLIVHLKRFQFSARTHRRQKIGVHVDFPLEGLDLTNQVLHWTDDEKPIYDCYAVSNHYGGLGGGHYTAYALNDGGVWCHYDDSRITSNVDPSEVVSQAAYVLYYRRRDVPIGLDFEMKLPTPEQVIPRPVMIQDPIIAKVRSREPSEISSSGAMVDDDEVMEEPDNGSRSTSPASADAVPDEYNYPDDEFSSRGGDDDNASALSSNKNDSSLPLQ